jgi:type II restriction/modification system DNA methylase subunit YeeA
MASIDLKEIPTKLSVLVENMDHNEFIYSLLDIYGISRASITKLRNGTYNVAKNSTDIDFKRKVYFRPVKLGIDLIVELENIVKKIHNKERFIIVTDYNSLAARDMNTKETIKISVTDLPKSYRFFAPWAGIEATETTIDNPADVKASMKMASLYSEIKKDNLITNEEETHAMNVFLSRILFCFFAEDTGIFDPVQFSDLIENYSKKEGSDLDKLLTSLFIVLDTKNEERKDVPFYLDAFPYVNGGLFRKRTKIPVFSTKSKKELIEASNRDWEHINPDIFGSMFQGVVSEEQRSNLGQHYTSVTNIMKVINPLFMDNLNEEFNKLQEQLDSVDNKTMQGRNEGFRIQKKMVELQARLSKIKVFDPACGSGNFLITAYKELCNLESKIIKTTGSLGFSLIRIHNFIGIEIDDFAAEIATLSLWLSQHQMNLMFFDEFNQMNPTLPLAEAGQIFKGNACRMDWEEVCPYLDGDELYICGNPPFGGQGHILEEQKKDKEIVFGKTKNLGYLDYVACWFIKASNFISIYPSVSASFVTTNSITQGTQVPLLWPLIFKKGIKIAFAHKSFLWKNNAQSQAGVTVAIIGLSLKNKIKPIIYNEIGKSIVNNINGYLINGSNVTVSGRSKLFDKNLPKIIYGSKPTDAGNLILSTEEKDELLLKFPEAKILIRKYLGSSEFINNKDRWCLWINENNLNLAENIPEIFNRLEKVRAFRLASSKKATQKQALTPFKFDEIRYNNTNSLIVPSVSSERRKYIPIGFVDKNTIITASAFAISDNSNDILLKVFSILTSQMHMIWVRNFAGRLKSDYRYSASLCYNPFPFPSVSEEQKKQLILNTQAILDTREYYFDKTNAWLYNPDTMPDDLKKVHEENDKYVESLYKPSGFKSDNERLEFLLDEYEKLVKEESN